MAAGPRPAWQRRLPAILLTALILLYTAAYTGLNIYRGYALRQGFDVLVYEQPIWNTVHGRPFAQSMYAFAPTHLGVDLVLFELWVAPVYALWQSEASLFLLISLGAGLGALPLFLIARERYASAWAGLGWAVLYLASVPVGAITLAEFQPRLFAATALLAAFWFARRERVWAFWLCLLLAITVRSDVGLVVGCVGLYWLSERRSWHYGLAPALVGFGYWAAAVFLIVPALAGGHGFLWQVNYRWLGPDARAMLTTLLTNPLYVAQGVFTLEKGRYLAQLLWPLACLPLLRPRLLLIPVPILALNLLSEVRVQFDVLHQYQALIIPFLFLAALYGLADLREAAPSGRVRRVIPLLLAAGAAAILLLPAWPGSAESRNGLHPAFAPLTLLAMVGAPLALGLMTVPRRRLRALPALPAAFGAVLLLLLLQHLAFTGQFLAPSTELREFVKNPGPDPRLRGAQRLIAQIPPDAPLAVTSQLAIHVPVRQQLYFFPGNDSYDRALVDRAHYVLSDRKRAPEQRAIDRLTADGGWRVAAQASDFVLLARSTGP